MEVSSNSRAQKRLVREFCSLRFPELDSRRREAGLGGGWGDKRGGPENQGREFSSPDFHRAAHLKMGPMQTHCDECSLLENIYFSY